MGADIVDTCRYYKLTPENQPSDSSTIVKILKVSECDTSVSNTIGHGWAGTVVIFDFTFFI